MDTPNNIFSGPLTLHVEDTIMSPVWLKNQTPNKKTEQTHDDFNIVIDLGQSPRPNTQSKPNNQSVVAFSRNNKSRVCKSK